ncbi:MAG TPA: tetratricopeptide repeat protein [Bacteroidia bacterium]|nr:tetratricopeptide repeat protein [Bacteroidia bacterium]
MKKIPLLLFLILVSSFSILKSQDRKIIDSLEKELKQFEANKKELGKNATPLIDTIKEEIVYQLVLQYWGSIPDTGLYYAQQIFSLSEQIGYRKGVGNAYNLMGLCNMSKKKYPVALDYYQKALKIRTEIGDKNGIAWTYNNLGLMYGNIGEPEDAISWHTKSLQVKEETGDKIGMGASYAKIGQNYMEMGKFPEAVNNYLNALKVFEEIGDKEQIGGIYRNIGEVYYREGNYPEALKNFVNELRIANESGDSVQIAFAYINMGRICYKQGNNANALNYLLAALKINEKADNLGTVQDIQYNLGLVYSTMGNYPLALSYADSSLEKNQFWGYQNNMARLYIEIGSIYEKQGKLRDALEAATKGLYFAEKIGARPIMKDAYLCLSDINTELQDYRSANEDYKEYISNLDSISSNESAKKMATLEMNDAFKKREDSATDAQEKKDIIKTAESHRKTIITTSAIVISLLTLLLAFVLINRQQLKRKKEKLLFEKDRILSEKEKDLLRLEKQHMEDELVNAKVMLDEYLRNMADKNELLEQFKIDIEELKDTREKETDKERIEKLEYLNKSTILTDEDWNKFKQLYEGVHKDFLRRLKEKMPDLTQAEIRLICLTKLDLGTKQMAGILGVSFETIRKSRYRLRKKLGLSEEDRVDDIIASI